MYPDCLEAIEMTKLFEEWLIELAKNEQFSLLERLPGYLAGHYAKSRDPAAEREKLAGYFANNAPRTPFSRLIQDVVAETK